MRNSLWYLFWSLFLRREATGCLPSLQDLRRVSCAGRWRDLEIYRVCRIASFARCCVIGRCCASYLLLSRRIKLNWREDVRRCAVSRAFICITHVQCTIINANIPQYEIQPWHQPVLDDAQRPCRVSVKGHVTVVLVLRPPLWLMATFYSANCLFVVKYLFPTLITWVCSHKSVFAWQQDAVIALCRYLWTVGLRADNLGARQWHNWLSFCVPTARVNDTDKLCKRV